MANNIKNCRPTKLTPEIRDEIVNLLKMGNYVETAVAVVGISKNTYYDWIQKANESTRGNKYTIFRDEVRKAQAWAEARDVAIIAKHSEKSWQASAWRLERKYPERWGKNRKEEKTKEPVNGDVSHIEKADRKIIKKVLDEMASRPENPREEPNEEDTSYMKR